MKGARCARVMKLKLPTLLSAIYMYVINSSIALKERNDAHVECSSCAQLSGLTCNHCGGILYTYTSIINLAAVRLLLCCQVKITSKMADQFETGVVQTLGKMVVVHFMTTEL